MAGFQAGAWAFLLQKVSGVRWQKTEARGQSPKDKMFEVSDNFELQAGTQGAGPCPMLLARNP